MDTTEFIEIPCIEIEQPIGTFYIGAIDYRDLINISVVESRHLDPELDDYLGIQRVLSKTRVEELRQYVNSVDATFPTGIILAIMSEEGQEYDDDRKNVSFSSERKTLSIRNRHGIAKVIDGQHRIKGLEGYTRNKNFQLNVTIFVDMEIEDQAMVFATINLAQTKVTKSLAYDLYEYTRARSPQKTSHNIARLLNSKGGSPFLNRIKILGTANPEFRQIQTITQATFVEALIKFISGNNKRALEDKNLLKDNKKPERASVEESVDLIFRNMFLDKKDAEIAKVVWNYFAAVDERWNVAWNNFTTTGNVLPRTNGFRALVRLLPAIYNKLGGAGTIPSQKDFLKIFEKIPLQDEDFRSENFLPGSSGEGTLYNRLLEEVNL
jgi:DGQHR domain-containing protein